MSIDKLFLLEYVTLLATYAKKTAEYCSKIYTLIDAKTLNVVYFEIYLDKQRAR